MIKASNLPTPFVTAAAMLRIGDKSNDAKSNDAFSTTAETKMNESNMPVHMMKYVTSQFYRPIEIFRRMDLEWYTG